MTSREEMIQTINKKIENEKIIARLWDIFKPLCNEGTTYYQYVTELTYIIFLKMAKENGAEKDIPEGYRWDNLTEKDDMELKRFYNRLLWELGYNCTGHIQEIYQGAKSYITESASLKEIIVTIDKLDWCFAKESLGKFYDALLEESAYNGRYGVEQNFTLRVLIDVMTELIAPKLGEKCNDPACGTFGFMIAADRYVKEHINEWMDLTEEQVWFQQKEAFSGGELVYDTRRLAIMNAMLHDIDGKILLCDTLSNQGKVMNGFDVILTNPGGRTKKGECVNRDDFDFQTSNQALNFLQHIYSSLKTTGTARAAVIVPDNVLFEEGEGMKIRNDLMDKCNLHTVLRLPKGSVFPRGTGANILFFTRGATDKGNTNKVWFYDLRTNMPFVGVADPLQVEHFNDFINAYTANDRHSVQDERWNVFSREELEDNLDKGLICESLVIGNTTDEILWHYLDKYITSENISLNQFSDITGVNRTTLTSIKKNALRAKGKRNTTEDTDRGKRTIFNIAVYCKMPFEETRSALQYSGRDFDERKPDDWAVKQWQRSGESKSIEKLNELIKKKCLEQNILEADCDNLIFQTPVYKKRKTHSR